MYIERILISIALSLSCLSAIAQSDIPYVTDDEFGATVTVRAKSSIYMPNEPQLILIRKAASYSEYFNFILNRDYFKAKKINKDKAFVVNGYARSEKAFHYDLYMVIEKKLMYFVDPADVIDNSMLEEKNKAMEREYNDLLLELDQKQRKYDSLYAQKEKEIDNAMAEISRREANSVSLIDSLYQVKLAARLNPMKEKYDAWYSSLSTLGQKTAKVLTINNSYLSSPNSASGCNYSLVFTNMSNKRIKYLTWYGNVLNAVDDKVACTIRNTYSFSGKDTGPYEPNAIGGGEWDCIIYNWSAKEMKLTRISIQYMDGTTATLSSKEIESVMDAPYSSIYDFEYTSIKGNAKDEYQRELKSEKSKWESRKNHLGDKALLQLATTDTRDYLAEISMAKTELDECIDKVKKFEERNFIVR